MSAPSYASLAVPLMKRLISTFKCSPLDSAAVLGNVSHESAGFTELHEEGVPYADGGIGIAQWTGPRRKLYESYCAAHKLNPMTFAAGEAYLFYELSGTYHSALVHTMAATNLSAKVAAFEKYYEGAGIVEESDRLAWAEKALAAYSAPSA
jgi:hypothetical protein